MTAWGVTSSRALCLGLLLGAGCAQAAAACDSWPRWENFKRELLSTDGRVVDGSAPRQHTVSEGQAYALLFALVANDHATFEKVLQWTENNLAQGDLTAHLPAWQWGRRDDGSWGVLDANSASDADLWMAYALTEAGRLWHLRRYTVLSVLIARRVLREETAEIPGLGASLLPGPVGFALANEQWRLNPSYVPPQLLRVLAANDSASSWNALLNSSLRLLAEPAVRGYAPDWAVFQKGRGFVADTQTQGSGSYNAIRVYLWTGMLSAQDPARANLLKVLTPMGEMTIERGAPPESVDVSSGAVKNDGPPGFSAALVPFLDALGEEQAARDQMQRAANRPPDDGAPAYYDSVLTLFGTGFKEKYFIFAADGALQPRWKDSCASTSSPPSLH